MYVYDAGGQRVAQIAVSELTGLAQPVSATVYLGDVQATDPDTAVTSVGDVEATRFVTFGGATVATHTVTPTASSWALLFGIARQKQERHVAGTTHPGGYLASQADAQAVLTAAHNGQVRYLGPFQNGGIVIKTKTVTGTHVNPRLGVSQRTNIFWIKGTNRPSIVPISRRWRMRR